MAWATRDRSPNERSNESSDDSWPDQRDDHRQDDRKHQDQGQRRQAHRGYGKLTGHAREPTDGGVAGRYPFADPARDVGRRRDEKTVHERVAATGPTTQPV